MIVHTSSYYDIYIYIYIYHDLSTKSEKNKYCNNLLLRLCIMYGLSFILLLYMKEKRSTLDVRLYMYTLYMYTLYTLQGNQNKFIPKCFFSFFLEYCYNFPTRRVGKLQLATKSRFDFRPPICSDGFIVPHTTARVVSCATA